MAKKFTLPQEIYEHYKVINEKDRLSRSAGIFEFERSKEILLRYLSSSPQSILDIGGAAGIYSFWLAALGHQVHLVDPMPNHIELAREKDLSSPHKLASISEGDVRALDFYDGFCDLIVCFGPFYHLTEKDDRLTALKECYRVLKPGGKILIAGISKYASLLRSGLFAGGIDDPVFYDIVKQDLKTGQHRNPIDSYSYFTTAYFSEVSSLESEVTASGFGISDTLAVEGPCWMAEDLEGRLKDKEKMRQLLDIARMIEKEKPMVAISIHYIISASKP